MIGRHPFDRLYSGWNDKSRTFRFQNGTFDFATAAKETTWLWGRTNLTKTQQGKSSIIDGHGVFVETHIRLTYPIYPDSLNFCKDSILKNKIIEDDKTYDPKKFGMIDKSENNDYRRRFSWNAFVDGIADSKLGAENFHNHHWKSQFYHCRVSLEGIKYPLLIINYDMNRMIQSVAVF